VRLVVDVDPRLEHDRGTLARSATTYSSAVIGTSAGIASRSRNPRLKKIIAPYGEYMVLPGAARAGPAARRRRRSLSSSLIRLSTR
jgi:hypothetical protein